MHKYAQPNVSHLLLVMGYNKVNDKCKLFMTNVFKIRNLTQSHSFARTSSILKIPLCYRLIEFLLPAEGEELILPRIIEETLFLQSFGFVSFLIDVMSFDEHSRHDIPAGTDRSPEQSAAALLTCLLDFTAHL